MHMKAMIAWLENAMRRGVGGGVDARNPLLIRERGGGIERARAVYPIGIASRIQLYWYARIARHTTYVSCTGCIELTN